MRNFCWHYGCDRNQNYLHCLLHPDVPSNHRVHRWIRCETHDFHLAKMVLCSLYRNDSYNFKKGHRFNVLTEGYLNIDFNFLGVLGLVLAIFK